MKIRSHAGFINQQRIGLQKLKPDIPRITVGLATCGAAVGGTAIFERLKKSIEEQGLDISLIPTGCIGYCREEPIVTITHPGKPLVLLHKVQEEDTDKILSAVESGSVPFDKALCRIEAWDHLMGYTINYGEGFEEIPLYEEIPFFGRQHKVILRTLGLSTPKILTNL